MRLSVAIFVFDKVEVLDFAGPYEVFTCASRMHSKREPNADPLFEVFTIGETKNQLRARAGLTVFPDYDFSHHPDIDLLVIPGGVVTDELNKPAVISWIGDNAASSSLTASVCTGAFLLAKAGLLQDKPATTHWEDIDELKHMFPSITVHSNRRWVDAGKIITSGGISAGIDMSLHLVERLSDRKLAEKTAFQMEFDWTENA